MEDNNSNITITNKRYHAVLAYAGHTTEFGLANLKYTLFIR